MTSPVKTITNKAGRTMRFGRRQLLAPRYGLNFMSYMIDLPGLDLPDEIDYTAKAGPVLSQMMLNDQLGDCTSAMCFHIDGVWQANAGKQVKFTNAQVEAFYSASTGYVHGNSATDQGGDESTVLDCWRTHGLYKSGHKILGHATVDATNAKLVKSAIYLFENVCFGVGLPDAWINPEPETGGFTWDVAGPAVEDNGHAFPGLGYDKTGSVKICTWGMLGDVTMRAAAKYATSSAGGEMHTAFGVDMINKASLKAPNSFKADELYADMKKFMAA